MKKSNQIEQIKRAIKNVGRSYDECQVDSEPQNNCLYGSIRSWKVSKEVEYQDQENIRKVSDEINQRLQRALKGFSIVEEVFAFHGDKNYFDVRVRIQDEKKAESKKKKAPKKSKKSSGKSNKAVAYLAWADGEKDVDKLHELVNQNVKKSTIKSWLSGWAKGRSLPAIAK